MVFCTQAQCLLDRHQVFHQEYPLVRGFLESHGVFQDLRIFHLGARPRSLSGPPPGLQGSGVLERGGTLGVFHRAGPSCRGPDTSGLCGLLADFAPIV